MLSQGKKVPKKKKGLTTIRGNDRHLTKESPTDQEVRSPSLKTPREVAAASGEAGGKPKRENCWGKQEKWAAFLLGNKSSCGGRLGTREKTRRWGYLATGGK